MWGHALTVAIVGFSVVFASLWILTFSVKAMSFFCKLVEKKGSAGGSAGTKKG